MNHSLHAPSSAEAAAPSLPLDGKPIAIAQRLLSSMLALVLAASLGFTGSLASATRAWADDDAAAQNPDADAAAASVNDASQAQNYFDDPSAYGDFDLDISRTPSDFNDDTSEDPASGYTGLNPTNLYVSYMNRDDYDQGQFSVADSLVNLGTSGASLDSMLKDDVGGKKKLNATDYKHFQYHANNSCAVPNRNEGENLVAISNIYVGTSTGSGDADRRSRQEIQLWRFEKGGTSPQKIGQANLDLVSGQKDDLQRLDAIDQDGSLGLTAMAGGDFDGDGYGELAVYVPDARTPRIDFYAYAKGIGFIKGDWSVPLSSLGSQFGGTFKNWYLPIVNLSVIPRTTGGISHDDLAITVSMPYTNYNGLDKRDQSTVMSIYSKFTGHSTSTFQEVFRYSPNYGSERMRFASTVSTDLNDNGVPELILAGNRNTYSSNDKMGKMDASTNLVQMITFNEQKDAYQPVWDKPHEVSALDNMNVTFEMCEPVAMASGKYLRDQHNALFLEGYVFTLSSTGGNPDSTEADLFKGGTFTDQFNMDVSGSNAFIKTAASGNFAKMNVDTEQLIVQSGTTSSGRDKTVSYDVRWVYEQNGQLKQFDTDLGFMHNKKSHDNGTFLTLCTVEANTKNAVQFKLKSKTYGWSAPEPIAVMEGVPYWGELVGVDDYQVGSTSFGISTSHTEGTEGNWSLGGGFNVSADLLLGGGLLGNDVKMGGGLNAEVFANYLGSYYTSNQVTHSVSYTENSGRDMVVCSATPVVIYEYEVWVPEFLVTQEYLDTYNANAPADKQWDQNLVGTMHPGTTVPCKVVNTYDPAMSMLTLEQYNQAAAKHASPDIEVLDRNALFGNGRATGDPTTYPNAIEQIPNQSSSFKLEPGSAQSVSPVGNASTKASVEVSETSELKNGFNLSYGGGLSMEVSASISFVVAASASAHAGWKLQAGGGASWVQSDATGTTFETDLPQLPEDSAANKYGGYSHSVQMAVWRTDAVKANPYVIGYVVTGTGPATAPKSLPRYPIVYSATDSEIVWAWSNATTRPAGAYGVALPSNDVWHVPSSNVLDGDKNTFTTGGLEPGGTQSIRFQAYDDKNKSNPSVLGRTLTGYATNSAIAPVFTTQPENALVPLGGTATFSASAKSQRGEQLDYQWYRLNTANSFYYDEWKPIEGETGPTLTVSNASRLDNNSLYYVEATDQTAANGQLPSTKSKQVMLKIDDQANAISDDDTNAMADDQANVVSNDNTNAIARSVPSIEFSFTKNDGTDASLHGDEFFLADGTTGNLHVQVTDSNGDFCTGTVEATAFYKNKYDDITLTQAKAGLPKTSLDPEGRHSWEFDTVNQSDRWDSAGRPEVYQVEITFKPDAQGATKWTESSTRLFINYGKVELDRTPHKTHYLVLDTDGVLPGLDEQDAASNDGAYKVAVAQNMALPDLTPQMVGAQFDGWYLDTDLTTPLSFPFAPLTPGETTTLHGAWLQDEYDIVYDLDGGTNDPDNPAVLTNDSPTVTLKNPTKDGYAFDGWYEVDDSGAEAAEPTAYIPRGFTHGLALRAKWSLIEYPIYYSTFAGANPSDNPSSYTVHDAVTIHAPLFEGAVPDTNAWYADSLFTQKAATDIPAGSTGSMVLYGQAEFPAPTPEPEPGPNPEPNPQPSPGPNADPTVPSGEPTAPTKNGGGLLTTGDPLLPGIIAIGALLLAALAAACIALYRRRS